MGHGDSGVRVLGILSVQATLDYVCFGVYVCIKGLRTGDDGFGLSMASLEAARFCF